MTSRDRQGSRQLAAERLKARRRRVALIRKRAVAGAACTFALAWGVIFVQLVSGHDPALAHTKATTSAASGTTTADSASSGSSSSGSTDSTSTSSGATNSGATNSGTSSVATSQS